MANQRPDSFPSRIEFQVSPDLQLVNKDFLADFLEEVEVDANPTLTENLQAKLDEYSIRFNQWDQDQSGDMDIPELISMLKFLGHTKTEREVINMVNKVDDDNTGTIRYREFVNLMLIHDKILNEPVEEREIIHQQTPISRKSFSVGFGAMFIKKKKRGAVRKPKRGHINVDVKLTKTQLLVKINEAQELLPCDLNGYSDPYVKVKLEPDLKESKRKTDTIKRNLNPQWDEVIVYELDEFPHIDRVLISVWDWDFLTKNDFMGAVSFSMQQILANESSGWFKLLDESQGAKHAFPSLPPKQKQSSFRIKTKSKQKPLTISDFDLLKVLGRGSFGKVFLVRQKQTKKMWAMKCLKKWAVLVDDDVEATLTERRVLTLEGKHNFLTQLHCSFQTPQCLFFVMELITGGDLMHLCDNKPTGKFSENETRFYIAEICCGLFDLHGRGILYRDLKLDNVMIDGEGHVKLADFGLAKFVGTDRDDVAHTFCGTPDYIAPEIINYQPYNKAIDYWSLGVLMFEMLTATQPFDGSTEDELFGNIVNTRVIIPRNISTDSVQLMRAWLTKDPSKRLVDSASIKQHRYFNACDWDGINDRRHAPPWVPKSDITKNFDSEYLSETAQVTPADKKQLAVITSKPKAFKDFDFVQGTIEEEIESD